nr:hypothetical protein [uncultured Brevundimonas sp.]
MILMLHNGQSIPIQQASAMLNQNIQSHHTLWRRALDRHAMQNRRDRDTRDGTMVRQLWAMIRGRDV